MLDRLIELILKCDKENDVLACYHERPKSIQAVVDDDFLDLINDAYIEEDVVEVVRCRDCMFWSGKDHDGVCIENGLATRMANEFCSRGKKKGGT